MIIGENRQAVIENIRNCAEKGLFNDKVELNDPVLTPQQEKAITDAYMENRNHPVFRLKSALCTGIIRQAAKILNRDTRIDGLENIPEDLGGVIITSNHFSPLENTVIRHLVTTLGRRDLGIISQTSNFAMSGPIGVLMNYGDTIPISTNPRYLAKDFLSILKERLVEKQQAILLYPEQEMWFHYRKPRPPKNGAYFYAAKLNVPILSCFVEILDREEDDTPEFRKVSFVLHVLGVLTPDPEKSVRENTEELASRDYALKCRCYEQCYGKKLCYDFEPADIAGWKGHL